MPQTDHETQTALQLWVILTRALRSIEQPLHRQVEAHGLTLTEFAVLEALLHKGPLPMGVIGEKILLTSGSTTYVIDKLEQRGLLQRRRCTDDRRVLHVDLTDDGRALIEAVFPEHAQLIRTLTEGLSTNEQGHVADQLKRLGRFAERYAQAAD